jgi:Domain of unknown function (DUF4349)
MRKAVLSIIGFLAVAGAIGYVATSGGHGLSSRTAGTAGTSPAAGRPTFGISSDEAGAPVAQPVAGSLRQGGAALLPAQGALPPIGLDIIKTASIAVQVRKGGFESAFDTATTIAGKYGGYVQDSSVRGTKARSGELTIRVPASSFEQAMNDLRRMGTVQGQSISGQDVTSQFIDLNARLRTWQAQEAVLLRLMRRATSIESTLRVQNQLQDVQFRIEQIKGQLRVLQNQTALATIDVSIREVGAPVTTMNTVVRERPSLGEAWARAVNGFLGVIFAVVVGLGYLVPLAALAAVIWLGYRRLRPRAAVS